MAVTVTATLTSSNPKVLTAPALGDTLDYRVNITGDDDAVTITAAPVDYHVGNGPSVKATPIGAWSFTLAAIENAEAPIVTGTLSTPFVQDPADPLHWSAVI